MFCSQMYCFLGIVKNCQKKEREVSMERLHLLRIGCMMKDSSYGYKSQKTNIKLYICKICSYAVIDIADSLVPHGKGAKDQGKVKALKPISTIL